MADALFDLDRLVASNQTNQEARVLLAWKNKSLRDFTIGFFAGSALAWPVTRLLTRWRSIRLYVSGVVGVESGLWKLGKAFDSSVDRILALEGSRLQKELANLILKKYQDNPQKMQLLSKHFFCEEVYDDSNSDKPELRWRYRHYLIDNITYGQRTSEAPTETGSSQPSCDSGSQLNPQKGSHISSSDTLRSYGTDETKPKVKRSPINPGMDLMGDPLDCIFGESTTREEIHHSTNSPAASPKALVGRSHGRSHRRRRRHQEVHSDSHA